MTVAQLFKETGQPPTFYGIRSSIGVSKTDSHKVLQNARCIQLTLSHPTIKKYALTLFSTTGLHKTLLRCFMPIVIPVKIGHQFINPHMHATRSISLVLLDVIIVVFGDG